MLVVTENKHTSNCCKILLSIMSRAGSASKSGAMAAKPTSTNKVLINVIYYSMYGHIATSKFSCITNQIIDLF